MWLQSSCCQPQCYAGILFLSFFFFGLKSFADLVNMFLSFHHQNQPTISIPLSTAYSSTPCILALDQSFFLRSAITSFLTYFLSVFNLHLLLALLSPSSLLKLFLLFSVTHQSDWSFSKFIYLGIHSFSVCVNVWEKMRVTELIIGHWKMVLWWFMFYSLTWLLIIWMCLLCENS